MCGNIEILLHSASAVIRRRGKFSEESSRVARASRAFAVIDGGSLKSARPRERIRPARGINVADAQGETLKEKIGRRKRESNRLLLIHARPSSSLCPKGAARCRQVHRNARRCGEQVPHLGNDRCTHTHTHTSSVDSRARSSGSGAEEGWSFRGRWGVSEVAEGKGGPRTMRARARYSSRADGHSRSISRDCNPRN